MRCVLAVVARLVAAVLAATTFANAKFVQGLLRQQGRRIFEFEECLSFSCQATVVAKDGTNATMQNASACRAAMLPTADR